MTTPKEIPVDIAAQLQEHFDHLIPRQLFLVKRGSKLNKVYRIPGSGAVKDDVTISFFVKKDDQGYFTEYFLNSKSLKAHRKWYVGSQDVEQLENFEGEYELLEDDLPYEEHQRIRKHNANVRSILLKKQFLRK